MNAVGAILSRARKKLREKAAKTALKRGGVDSLGLAVNASVTPPPPAAPPAPPTDPPKSAVLRPVKPTKPTKPPKDKKNGE